MVQWLGLRHIHCQGLGSDPGWGAKILHAIWCGQNFFLMQHVFLLLNFKLIRLPINLII